MDFDPALNCAWERIASQAWGLWFDGSTGFKKSVSGPTPNAYFQGVTPQKFRKDFRGSLRGSTPGGRCLIVNECPRASRTAAKRDFGGHGMAGKQGLICRGISPAAAGGGSAPHLLFRKIRRFVTIPAEFF